MVSIKSRAHEAASHHAAIVQALAETDSAPSRLEHQTAYIAELNAQLVQTTERVQLLSQRTTAELEDHDKYSESTFRRWVHKASGRGNRFEEKAAQEGREYFDAIQAQRTAEDELDYIRQLKTEAELAHHKYKQAAIRHAILQDQLSRLYNVVFAGHTPEFPDEDRNEADCRDAHHNVQTLNQNLERERRTLYLLRHASTKLSKARRCLDDAHDMTHWDMFGGGAMVSTQKRNDLERAESYIQQVRMLQQQLKQIAPHLPSLGELNIAMGSIWADMIFDNICTDMDMHDKIKDSEKQVDQAVFQCKNMVRESEQRKALLHRKLKGANERLGHARVELQKVREAAFTSLLQEQQGALPGYDRPLLPYPV
jgi:hypothetical protein